MTNAQCAQRMGSAVVPASKICTQSFQGRGICQGGDNTYFRNTYLEIKPLIIMILFQILVDPFIKIEF
jgi:hypothetical protein